AADVSKRLNRVWIAGNQAGSDPRNRQRRKPMLALQKLARIRDPHILLVLYEVSRQLVPVRIQPQVERALVRRVFRCRTLRSSFLQSGLLGRLRQGRFAWRQVGRLRLGCGWNAQTATKEEKSQDGSIQELASHYAQINGAPRFVGYAIPGIEKR